MEIELQGEWVKIKQFIDRLATRMKRTKLDGDTPGSLYYQCNICGQMCLTPFENITRETASCSNCRSTVRMRSIVHAISLALFDKSIALPDFPVMSEKRIIGLSDWNGYATPLSHKVNYTNTFYHQEPKLDIMSIQPEMHSTLDILISSDVFEHVAPPVSSAFENSFKLLKPGGTLVLTVPFTLSENTVEHFSNLYQYEIRKEEGEYVLYNTTRSKHTEIFKNLVFHGGEGETLEMRIFSLKGLTRDIELAGFRNMSILSEPCFKYGIYFNVPWSLPIIAHKPIIS